MLTVVNSPTLFKFEIHQLICTFLGFGIDFSSDFSYNSVYRGVAQLVARLTGGQEAASSSLVTPTNKSRSMSGYFLLYVAFRVAYRI